MKILDGIVLRPLAGNFVAVPTGNALDAFNGIIRLNETGKLIFESIEQGMDKAEIAEKIVETYDGVTKEQAMLDFEKNIAPLIEKGIILAD